MFLLLEAHEAPSASKGKRNESLTDGALGETLGYLLQGVDPVSEPLLWRSLEDKIMGYFSKSSPVNATKVSAKIVDALVNGNPACLSRVLPLLLDNDVVSLNCSHDKLAFRLRLAGGAVRSCQGMVTFEQSHPSAVVCLHHFLSALHVSHYIHHLSPIYSSRRIRLSGLTGAPPGALHDKQPCTNWTHREARQKSYLQARQGDAERTHCHLSQRYPTVVRSGRGRVAPVGHPQQLGTC